MIRPWWSPNVQEYRGRVENGVVVVEGLALQEGAVVKVIPVNGEESRLGRQPAFGIWRDRDDLADSSTAARKMREGSSNRAPHG